MKKALTALAAACVLGLTACGSHPSPASTELPCDKEYRLGQQGADGPMSAFLEWQQAVVACNAWRDAHPNG